MWRDKSAHFFFLQRLVTILSMCSNLWSSQSCNCQDQSHRKSVKIYMNHKNLHNFATAKQLNWWQICWIKQLINFEFKIHYKKSSKNSDINVLSQQSDYEKVKIIHKEILKENSEKILTKNLITTHHMKSVSQNDDDVIRECHKTRVSRHLKVKRTEDFVWWRCNLQNNCKRI